MGEWNSEPIPVLKIRRRRSTIDEDSAKRKKKIKHIYEVESPPSSSSSVKDLFIPIGLFSPCITPFSTPITPGKSSKIFNFDDDDLNEQDVNETNPALQKTIIGTSREPGCSSDDEPIMKYEELVKILDVHVVVPPPSVGSPLSDQEVIITKETCDAHTQTEPSEFGTMSIPTIQEKTPKSEPTCSQYDRECFFLPYQPRKISGTSLGQHIIYHKYYQAIEVIKFDKSKEDKKMFPTKWLFITCLYWNEFRSEKVLARIGGKGNRMSSYDGVIVFIEVQDNGTIWATRNGTTVIIKYPDGSTGDLFQCNSSQVVRRTSGGTKYCVPTEDIAPDCPYWHNLVDKLEFKKTNKGFSKIVHSPDDDVSCMVCAEANGQIDVQRNNVRVRIRQGV